MFGRTVDGTVLDFGTTGLLRFSNLVMYDRQTESWWQQADGKAIVGTFLDRRLKFLPSQVIAWGEFKQQFPNGKVLSRETGFRRPYGVNPYTGYDTSASPFLFDGPTDERLEPMAHVAGVAVGAEAVAFPLAVLERERAVNHTVGGEEIVLLFEPGTASAVDAGSIAQGRDIGSTGVFKRTVNGRTLTFRPDDGRFKDEETGTIWDILGNAVDGALRGSKLEAVPFSDHFWFSWAVFRPGTTVYRGANQ